MSVEQEKDLISSIIKALPIAGITGVSDEEQNIKTDGVMLARFESDPSCSGAIFAEIRDRNGNFL